MCFVHIQAGRLDNMFLCVCILYIIIQYAHVHFCVDGLFMSYACMSLLCY